MADTYTKEELIEIYRGLPEEIKDAIFSPETTDIFDAIKEKQHLTDEQREIMSVYTGFLMMGILPPEKYVPTLITKMGVEREKVASIAQIINRDLFNPIKHILKEVHAGKKGNTESKIAAVPPTQEAIPTTKVENGSTEETMETSSKAMVTPRISPMMTPSTAPIKEDSLSQTTSELTASIPPSDIKTAPILTSESKEIPAINKNESQTDATQPHIGSIFEQKLGGEFRLKSDAVTYTNQMSDDAPSETPALPTA